MKNVRRAGADKDFQYPIRNQYPQKSIQTKSSVLNPKKEITKIKEANTGGESLTKNKQTHRQMPLDSLTGSGIVHPGRERLLHQTVQLGGPVLWEGKDAE